MRLSKNKIFLFVCLAFITGVGAASFMPKAWLDYDLYYFGIGMFFLTALMLFWKNINFRLIGLLGLFLFLGIWRYSLGLPVDAPDKIWYYNGQTVKISGIIINEPDERERSIKYKVETRKLRKSNALKNSSIDVLGVVLVSSGLYPRYKYGDAIEFECDLRAPEEFSGFAYDRYLARYDIYSVCYYPKIVKLDSGQGNKLYANIFKFKNKLRLVIGRGLSEPAAGLARAMVLGDKRAISDHLRAVFSRAGISHIVAISGLHISFLAVLIMGLLLWLGLGRQSAIYGASLILFLYIVLIGLPASAMRAGLMGFLVMLSLSFGRLAKITNALALSAAILLIINPKLLRDDVGFQLSFLALTGIVFIYPIINRYLYRIRQPVFKKIIRNQPGKTVFDILIVTVSAQALVLPIIAANFSQVSVIAPLTNLLVLWTLPFVMTSILAGAVLGLVVPGLALIFFLPAGVLLNYIIFMAEKLSSWPQAYIEVAYVWSLWWGIYYIIIGWIIFKFKPKKRKI